MSSCTLAVQKALNEKRLYQLSLLIFFHSFFLFSCLFFSFSPSFLSSFIARFLNQFLLSPKVKHTAYFPPFPLSPASGLRPPFVGGRGSSGLFLFSPLLHSFSFLGFKPFFPGLKQASLKKKMFPLYVMIKIKISQLAMFLKHVNKTIFFSNFSVIIFSLGNSSLVLGSPASIAFCAVGFGW